ncbi:MAG: tetratricopeptide repeat protein [Archangium sp.]|nr:tetratricopeptide repeat protein [Archangium sp.]
MRTWRFWLILVVAFLVSYQLFSGGWHPDPAFWTTSFPVVLAGIFVTLFLFFYWLHSRGGSDCIDGSALMSQGKLEEALVLLTRSVEKSPRVAAFEYTRANCLLQLLRLDEADRAFQNAQQLPQPKSVREYYAATGQLVLALQGKPALAAGAPASADRVLTRAVELVRKGEWQAALEQLANPSQHMLWGTTRVLKEVLSAWCHERVSGEKRSVDLTLLRQPGVADVRTFWPELADQLPPLQD